MKTLALILLAATALFSGCVSSPVNKWPPGRQLGYFAMKQDKRRIEKLLAEGAVPGEGSSPEERIFNWTRYYDRPDIAQLLMKRCAEAYVEGKNCFEAPCFAAAQGDIASLSAFIGRGLDVNRIFGQSAVPKDNVVGSTVLECARGQAAATKLLIEHGAKERVLPVAKVAAAPATGGGISKVEMEQIVMSAVAATKAQTAPSAPAEIKSDVDQPAYTVPANPDAFAFVVGVEKYNSLPDARFAERDAKAMNAHLLAMGYPQRNIVLLTGANATKTGLIKNLEAWLPNQVTERSTVLFYFSGHGAPDAKTSAAYLVPTDGDPQYLEETAYPMKRLYEKLGALKAKRVLVALDSCFSGAGGRSVIASGTRPLVAKLTLAPTEAKVVSLSASSAEEITGALEDQGHGLFTYHLLKALSETAGRGSVSELHAALTPRVQDEARRQNRSQTPQMFGASVDGGLR